IAMRFAQEGAKVVINSKSSVAEGKQVVEDIKSLGHEAIYVQSDLSQPSQVKFLFEETVRTFGTVDILINNAGQAVGEPFLELTKEHWLAMFNNNLFNAVLCSREAAQIMLRQGHGKILNTTSVRGLTYGGREGIMAYSAAKAALINFTKTLAKELAPMININAVAPGFVATSMIQQLSEETKQGFINSTAIKRFIDTDEIAEAFLYLAKADAVTGEVLVVDGGFSLKFA
ncbi:MAG: SDR family oxidoreductase, partial [Moorea sp. SIO4G2]|nr:SDR family oxidoreductase [Moorena sp. SIO4G2]